jgi:hypothetical protein
VTWFASAVIFPESSNASKAAVAGILAPGLAVLYAAEQSHHTGIFPLGRL